MEKLFSKTQSYLTPSIIANKDRLLSNIIVKILLSLLFEDINTLSTKSEDLSFDFEDGIISSKRKTLKKTTKSKNGNKLAVFCGFEILAVANGHSKKQHSDRKQVFIKSVYEVILTIMKEQYPNYFQ